MADSNPPRKHGCKGLCGNMGRKMPPPHPAALTQGQRDKPSRSRNVLGLCLASPMSLLLCFAWASLLHLHDRCQSVHSCRKVGQTVTVNQEPGEAPCHLPPSTASLNAGKGRLWLTSKVVFCACLATRSFSVEEEGPSIHSTHEFSVAGLRGQASLFSAMPQKD